MIDPDLVALYTESLQDLKENNRIFIHNLTDHARDHEADAESIVTAIENYVKRCDPGKRLFVLYVLDSIVKNVKGRYPEVFSPRLLTIFSAVWDAVPTQRERLLKVLRLWNGHFPEDVLQPLRDWAGLETPGSTTPLMSPESPGSYQPTRPAASQQAYYQAAPAPIPQVAAYPPYLSATVTAPAPAPINLLQPGYHSQAYARPVAVPAAGYMTQQVLQQPVTLYAAQPQPYAMAPASGYMSAAAAPQGGSSQAAASTLQQPYAAPSPAAAREPSPGPSAPDSRDDQERTIQSINSILGASTSGAAQPPQVLQTTDFASLPLKEYYPGVIELLQQLSDQHRPQLLNIQFTRRRRQKLNPARHRQWFATADQWVVVTAGISDVPPTFFEEDERAAEEVPECSEPLDESQTECAISGDTFEVYWDAATETHRYRHAKRLYGEEAAAYGVADGSLVNVKSLLSMGQPMLVDVRAAAAAVKPEPQGRGPQPPPGEDGLQQGPAGSSGGEGQAGKRPHDAGMQGGSTAGVSVGDPGMPSLDADALEAARKKVKMDPDAVEPAAVNC